MTKRDFELIARVIRSVPSWDESDSARRRELAMTFANALTETNPRFDRERFLEACRP